MNPLYDTFLVEQDTHRATYTTEDQNTLTPSHHYMDPTVERALRDPPLHLYMWEATLDMSMMTHILATRVGDT